jgi:crotonobetainyl-CoA:carnitine CoA-transferase CaiB-like acyl-CoA transferase
MTANEELFVAYISQGLSPEDAYVKAFPTNNKRYARMKAVNLIKTERVKTAVKEELKPILEELEIDEKMVLENIKIVAQTAEKDDTKLKALFKLSDILDLEDKGSAKVQQVTGIAFQGLTDDMIDAAERPKEIKSE